MLNQVITLYQLTHSLISSYKKTTENLFKLDNAEVVCVIPKPDASRVSMMAAQRLDLRERWKSSLMIV